MRTMTGNEWFFLLRGLGQDEELLFFPISIQSNKVMEEYLPVRNKWIDEGIIELDFDGIVKCKPEFFRDVYNLTDWRSLTRVDEEEKTFLFVQGPVDFLKAEYSEGTVCFESIRHTAFQECLDLLVSDEKTRRMTTKRHEDAAIEETDFAFLSFRHEQPRSSLDRHLKLIYRRAEDGKTDKPDNQV